MIAIAPAPADAIDRPVTDNPPAARPAPPLAAEELIRQNLGLARTVANDAARRNRRPDLDNDDFYQEALIGLIRAARAFRPEIGMFAGFAGVCMRRQIQKLTRRERDARAKGFARGERGGLIAEPAARYVDLDDAVEIRLFGERFESAAVTGEEERLLFLNLSGVAQRRLPDLTGLTVDQCRARIESAMRKLQGDHARRRREAAGARARAAFDRVYRANAGPSAN